jgi:hypothetical protein
LRGCRQADRYQSNGATNKVASVRPARYVLA